MYSDPELHQAFRLLGLNQNASEEDVKRAYRKCAKRFHPDRYAADPDLQQVMAERLKRINSAYQRIKTCFSSGPAPRTRWPAAGPSVREPRADGEGLAVPPRSRPAVKPEVQKATGTFRAFFARAVRGAADALPPAENPRPSGRRPVKPDASNRMPKNPPGDSPITRRSLLRKQARRAEGSEVVAPITPIAPVRRI
ncbi:MAG: DnaJ domain-containing protein [Thermodesulfobacteriota bacterium]